MKELGEIEYPNVECRELCQSDQPRIFSLIGIDKLQVDPLTAPYGIWQADHRTEADTFVNRSGNSGSCWHAVMFSF